MKKHVISILVEDRFGALARVVELFTSRGYNLESVCTGEAAPNKAARMADFSALVRRIFSASCFRLCRVMVVAVPSVF